MKTCLAAFVMASLMSVSTLHAQQPGALGVTMSDNPAGGVTITSVLANSPAAVIGLRSGDRILAVNDQPMNSYRDVMRVIGSSQANTPVMLYVARGAWRGNLTARLGVAAVVLSQPPVQFVPIMPPQPYVPYMPSSVEAYINSQGWGRFPRDWHDNGSRGASAAYGGGGW